MNTLVARLTGKSAQRPLKEEEAAPIPAAVRPQDPVRGRSRLSRHRRVAAAMLGLGEAEAEDDESIIPDDAEPIDNIAGPSGIKLDKDREDDDKRPKEPDHPVASGDDDVSDLLTPKDALVAPDVTPQSFEPIDPAEVPAPKETPKPIVPPAAPKPPPVNNQPEINPMDVLLGRVSPKGAAERLPEEPIVTAEAAQATVNSVLGVNGGGDGLLRQGQAMPDPVASQPGKIMETFYKYGPKPSLKF